MVAEKTAKNFRGYVFAAHCRSILSIILLSLSLLYTGTW